MKQIFLRCTQGRAHLLLAIASLVLASACANDVALPTSETGPSLSVDKAQVCHVDQYGAFRFISIGDPALAAHMAHGDGQPGDVVPGQEGKKFAADCSLVNRAGVTSNQDAYGAEFGGSEGGHLKFLAYQGTGGNLGNFDWKYGNPLSPAFAFSGTIISATENGSGVWALLVDITAVTATGGTSISDACTITFFVTTSAVTGWTWGSEAGCDYGSVSGLFPLTYGTITNL